MAIRQRVITNLKHDGVDYSASQETYINPDEVGLTDELVAKLQAQGVLQDAPEPEHNPELAPENNGSNDTATKGKKAK